MKIGINLTFVIDSIQNGTGNHAKDIIDGLYRMGKAEEFFIITRKNFCGEAKKIFPGFEVIEAENSKLLDLLIDKTGRFKFLQTYYINFVGMKRAVRKLDLDLMLHTFNERRIKFEKNIPNIIVIHDMHFKNFPARLSPLRYFETKYAYKYFVEKADAIVTISDFVKNDLLSYYKFADDSKFHVITNAVYINEDGKGKSTMLPCPKPYILCVNNHQYHKNCITLLKAFKSISHKINHNLVYLGKKEWEITNLIKYINENNLSDRVYLIDSLSEDDRNNLYRNADLFVSPSLHEGFGRTPIEASMFKIPVITTRETSLPEITMELVNYYEPATNYENLSKRIMEVLKNPPSDEELSKIKDIYENKYSSELIAQDYYDLCRSLVAKNK